MVSNTPAIIQDGRIQSGILSNILRGIVPTASNWDGQIGYAFQDDGGVFTDETVDANDADAGDVALLPAAESINDAFYFGENFSTSQPFNSLKFNISQAAVGGTLVWEYYNGAAWVDLNPTTDETVLLTVAGSKYVKWTEPVDWAATVVNGQNRYWVRIRVSAANITQQPLATQIWCGREPTDLSNTTDGLENTKSGTGVCLMGAAGYFGYVVIDFQTAKMRLLSVREKVFSSAGAVSIYVQESSDGSTFPNGNGGTYIATMTSTSGTEVNTAPFITTQRYVRFGFYISAASTANAYISEFSGWELGR